MGMDSGDGVTLQGYAKGDASPHLDSVAPGYFSALGIALLRGREFTAADRGRALKPIVIDAVLARRYFAGRDPLGQLATVHFTFGDQTYQIVGVVAHAQPQSLLESASIPRIYFDIENRGGNYPVRGVVFELRSVPGAALTRPEINRLAATVAGAPAEVTFFTTVQALLDSTLAANLLLAQLAGFFAALALGLSALGLYALLSQALARRRAEIAVRMALGAGGGQIAMMVLGSAAAPLAAGIALGVGGSLLLGRYLASLLFQVRPSDPASLASAALVLVAAGLGAALIPALRARRTDPARILRCE